MLCRLTYSLILWKHSVNWGSILLNDLSLCQVDISQPAPSPTSLLEQAKLFYVAYQGNASFVLGCTISDLSPDVKLVIPLGALTTSNKDLKKESKLTTERLLLGEEEWTYFDSIDHLLFQIKQRQRNDFVLSKALGSYSKNIYSHIHVSACVCECTHMHIYT